MAKSLEDIVKTWGFEKASWNRFTEIRYFFGDPEATLVLSKLSGVRGEKELEDIYLLEAAYRGNSKAQIRIFYRNYNKGNILADKMAIALMKDQNFDPKIYLGERMLIRREYTYAYELFKSAYEQEAYNACGYIGFFHYTGILGSKDTQMADYYWTKGALNHDPLSEYFLAIQNFNTAKNKRSYEYRFGIRLLFCSTTHKFRPAQALLSEIILDAIENNEKAVLKYIGMVFKRSNMKKDEKHANDLFKFYSDFK